MYILGMIGAFIGGGIFTMILICAVVLGKESENR